MLSMPSVQVQHHRPVQVWTSSLVDFLWALYTRHLYYAWLAHYVATAHTPQSLFLFFSHLLPTNVVSHLIARGISFQSEPVLCREGTDGFLKLVHVDTAIIDEAHFPVFLFAFHTHRRKTVWWLKSQKAAWNVRLLANSQQLNGTHMCYQINICWLTSTKGATSVRTYQRPSMFHESGNT